MNTESNEFMQDGTDYIVTSKRTIGWGVLLMISPLLLPLGVFLFLNITGQGKIAPSLPTPRSSTVQVALIPQPVATTITWTGSLDWALQNARSSGKPIMIDFYTDT